MHKPQIQLATLALLVTIGCSASDAEKDSDLGTDIPGDATSDGDAVGEGTNGDDTGDADDTGGGDTGGSDTGSSPVDPSTLPVCRASDGHDTSIEYVPPTTGDMLELQVAYGGGCETHQFTLCWPDPVFMESDPVQVSLELLHTGPPDACDAWITETISLDLTPLAESWRASYDSDHGEIIIWIGETQTVYSF